jgi:hypothetical protein
MAKFAWIAGIVLVLVAVAVGALVMSDLYVSGAWRYRLTVAVETPEGTKEGSAVREAWASASSIRIGLPESTSKTNIRGEAVVVDLGERGVLFALINSGSYREVSETFPYTAAKGIPDRIRHFKNLEPGLKADLARKEWPRMVTFGDLSDPKSVKAVEPHDLAAAFGEGVSLKGITVEITDEPVTWGIEEWLSWLPEYYDRMFDGRRFNTIEAENRLANSLSAGSFSTGRASK